MPIDKSDKNNISPTPLSSKTSLSKKKKIAQEAFCKAVHDDMLSTGFEKVNMDAYFNNTENLPFMNKDALITMTSKAAQIYVELCVQVERYRSLINFIKTPGNNKELMSKVNSPVLTKKMIDKQIKPYKKTLEKMIQLYNKLSLDCKGSIAADFAKERDKLKGKLEELENLMNQYALLKMRPISRQPKYTKPQTLHERLSGAQNWLGEQYNRLNDSASKASFNLAQPDYWSGAAKSLIDAGRQAENVAKPVGNILAPVGEGVGWVTNGIMQSLSQNH